MRLTYSLAQHPADPAPTSMTDLDARWRLPPGLSARLLSAAGADPGVLTVPERDRLAAFGHPARRRQFVLGRTAARTLAAARLGVAPADVDLGVGADGAPEVPGLHVSIAHTGRESTAALAAVAGGPVGVDLERIAPRRPDLWTRILRPDEHALLDALGGPDDIVQTLLWTMKEAVLKAQRTGFRAGGQSVHLAFDAAPDGAPPDLGWATAASGAGDWRVAFGREGDLWLAVAWADGSQRFT